MVGGAIDWTVIGVGIALASVVIALAGLILATTRGIRADMRVQLDRLDKRIDGLSARMDERIDGLSARQDQLAARMDEKFDAFSARQDQFAARMDERMGRLEQEQARMNGVLETIRDVLFARAGRREMEAGERVAEAGAEYEAEE